MINKCQGFHIKEIGNMFSVFLSSYRNTSESLGEREMLWEHEPQVSVSTAFSSTAYFFEYRDPKKPLRQNLVLVCVSIELETRFKPIARVFALGCFLNLNNKLYRLKCCNIFD